MKNLMLLAARKNVRFPKVIVTTLCMLMLGLVAGTQNSSAQELTAVDLSAMTQSSVSDYHALLLALFAGYKLPQPGAPDQTINYSSTATDSTWANWTGSLSGNYFGQTLNLNYVNGTGSVGIVSWDTTGTFGGASITGSGNSTISYPTSSTFDLTLSDTLVYGGDTYALNYDIPGSILTNGDIMFGSPGNEEVGTGTLTKNSATFEDPFWSYYKVTDKNGKTKLVLSDICWGIPIGIGLKNKYDSEGNLIAGIITSDTTLVPEPATIMLLGLGGLAMIRRRRQGN